MLVYPRVLVSFRFCWNMLTLANFHVEGGSVAKCFRFFLTVDMYDWSRFSLWKNIQNDGHPWRIPWSMGKILHQLTLSLIKINHRFIIKLTLSVLIFQILSIKTFWWFRVLHIAIISSANIDLVKAWLGFGVGYPPKSWGNKPFKQVHNGGLLRLHTLKHHRLNPQTCCIYTCLIFFVDHFFCAYEVHTTP